MGVLRLRCAYLVVVLWLCYGCTVVCCGFVLVVSWLCCGVCGVLWCVCVVLWCVVVRCSVCSSALWRVAACFGVLRCVMVWCGAR